MASSGIRSDIVDPTTASVVATAPVSGRPRSTALVRKRLDVGCIWFNPGIPRIPHIMANTESSLFRDLDGVASLNARKGITWVVSAEGACRRIR